MLYFVTCKGIAISDGYTDRHEAFRQLELLWWEGYRDLDVEGWTL